mgnify:CR=1 FL=1
MKILALDMSSTMIGVCYDGRQFETIKLKGDDISQRCRDAHRLIAGWVLVYGDIDLVVIESPVGRFAKALIPQARATGDRAERIPPKCKPGSSGARTRV